MKIAVESVSSFQPAVLICFGLSLLSSDGVPTWMVELFGFNLDLCLRETAHSVRILMEAGLLTVCNVQGKFAMHEVVQGYVQQELRHVQCEVQMENTGSHGRHTKSTEWIVSKALIALLEKKTTYLGETPTELFYNTSTRSLCLDKVDHKYRTHLETAYSLSILTDLRKLSSCLLEHAKTLTQSSCLENRLIACHDFCRYRFRRDMVDTERVEIPLFLRYPFQKRLKIHLPAQSFSNVFDFPDFNIGRNCSNALRVTTSLNAPSLTELIERDIRLATEIFRRLIFSQIDISNKAQHLDNALCLEIVL